MTAPDRGRPGGPRAHRGRLAAADPPFRWCRKRVACRTRARVPPGVLVGRPTGRHQEFVARNGEFTVNIALIAQGRPVMGVVVRASSEMSYWAWQGGGAFRRQRGDAAAQRLHVAVPREAGRPLRVMASKHHFHEDTRALIARMGAHELVQAGSSLKFCRIAEGAADVYPRRAPRASGTRRPARRWSRPPAAMSARCRESRCAMARPRC